MKPPMILENLRFAKDIRGLKLLALDFDGTLTDGYVYVTEDGKESVRCSRKDSMGISALKKNGVKVVVISKEINPVVLARCRKLEVDCYSGVDDKLGVLKKIIQDINISWSEVAFMGDDVNDLEVLSHVGLKITVADGHALVKDVCNIITQANGGEHAVREACDLILTIKNQFYS